MASQQDEPTSVLPGAVVRVGWALLVALVVCPPLLVFWNVHSAPDLALWFTLPVVAFVAFGSVIWFVVAIVLAVRRFRAGALPATREFVQLCILGVVAAYVLHELFTAVMA